MNKVLFYYDYWYFDTEAYYHIRVILGWLNAITNGGDKVASNKKRYDLVLAQNIFYTERLFSTFEI